MARIVFLGGKAIMFFFFASGMEFLEFQPCSPTKRILPLSPEAPAPSCQLTARCSRGSWPCVSRPWEYFQRFFLGSSQPQQGANICCTKYLDYSYFGISDEGYLTIPRICMHLLGVIFWQWHRARSPFCKSATTQAPGRNKCCVNREAPCVITWSGQIRPLEEIPCTDPSSEKIWEDSYSRWLSWSEWCQIVPISTCPQNNNW